MGYIMICLLLTVVCYIYSSSITRHHFIVDTDLFILSPQYGLNESGHVSQMKAPVNMPLVLKCNTCPELAYFYDGEIVRMYKQLKDRQIMYFGSES